MNKYNGFLAAATLVLGLPITASAQQLDWMRTYERGEVDERLDSLYVEDGDVYVVWDTNSLLNLEISTKVQKLSSMGEEEWRASLSRYYSDWTDYSELDYADVTETGQHGFYYLRSSSSGIYLNAKSPEGEDLWRVKADNSQWFNSDYPKIYFDEIHAGADSIIVSARMIESAGADVVPYMLVFDLGGEEISRQPDLNKEQFNSIKYSGTLNYSVDYDANEISVYANDGSINRVITAENPIQSVDVYNNQFYITESVGTVASGGYQLVQYSLEGESTNLNFFNPKFPKTNDDSITTVKVDADGIYTFGYQYLADCCEGDIIYRLAQYDFYGELVRANYYPDIEGSKPWSLLAVNEGAAYLAIDDPIEDLYFDIPSNYIAKISLGDSEYFDLPELSVHLVDQLPDGGAPGVMVVSEGLANNTLIQQLPLDGDSKTSLLTAYPQSGREAHIQSTVFPKVSDSASVASLMQSQIKRETGRVERTFVYLSTTHGAFAEDSYTNGIEFNRNDVDAEPLGLMVIPDQNGNGNYELGVVSVLPNKKGVFVEVRDSILDADEPLYRVSFNPNFAPKDVALVQDLDGDERPEIALLSVNESQGQSKIEIRSLDGNLIKNMWPGNSHVAEFFVDGLLDANFAPIPATELAVVQTKASNTGVRVVTMDVATGEAIKYKGLNPNFTPVKAVTMQNINSNGANEYAVLSQSRTMVDGKEQLQARVDVVDGGSNKIINRIWHQKNATVYDLTVLPDQNGNQAPEVGTMIWQDGGLKLIIQDSLTDELIGTHSFSVVH